MQNQVKSGLYVVRYKKQKNDDDNDLIKIGRSSNIDRRLKSYNGYVDNSTFEILHKIPATDHKNAEKMAHKFASSNNAQRQGRTEKFLCKNTDQLINGLKSHLQQHGISTSEAQQYVQTGAIPSNINSKIQTYLKSCKSRYQPINLLKKAFKMKTTKSVAVKTKTKHAKKRTSKTTNTKPKRATKKRTKK